MDKVSIIVPFYGVEQYIDACLDSLVRQTHEDIEIVCVDDCSPDGSLRIVEQYAAIDKRVRLLRHETNKGLGGARNTGLQNSHGEYLCFVDSDDYVADNFVELLLNSLKSHQADIVICNIWQDQDGAVTPYETKYRDECLNLSPNKDNTFETAGRFNPACWNKMFTRRLLLDNKLSQPEKRYYEDVAFWVKAVFHSSRVCSIADFLYYYRQRSGSIMSSVTRKHIADRFLFLDELDRFANDQLTRQEPIDKSRIAGATLQYFLKHIHYGESLLDDLSDTERNALHAFYQESIETFARTHSWPTLPMAYQLYKKEVAMRCSLAAERNGHDATKAQLVDVSRLLNEARENATSCRRRLIASVGLSLLAIGLLLMH